MSNNIDILQFNLVYNQIKNVKEENINKLVVYGKSFTLLKWK